MKLLKDLVDRIGRWQRLIAIAIATALLTVLGHQTVLHVSGNFHAVVDGQLYRSAQPDRARLLRYATTYGIRTIVNLRGAHPGAAWYDEERVAALEAGVDIVDFGMSASEVLPPERLADLVTLLRDLPKPILIHCRAGSDRTGLASVLYAFDVAGIDEENAEKQLSIYFGHFGIPLFSPTYAMDKTWELHEDALGLNGS